MDRHSYLTWSGDLSVQERRGVRLALAAMLATLVAVSGVAMLTGRSDLQSAAATPPTRDQPCGLDGSPAERDLRACAPRRLASSMMTVRSPRGWLP